MKLILLMMVISLSLWANIGKIMTIKGSAEVHRAGESLDASMGMTLLKGDEITANEKSRVQVMLKDETVVTIGAKSSFSFEEFEFDGTKNSKVQMRANRGFFRSVTGKIGKVAPERFKVKTASAVIGIRGTDFSGELYGDSEVFRCYSGKIYIEFNNQVKEIEVGDMIRIKGAKFIIEKFDLGAVYGKIINSDILTEIASDITQIIEERDNEPTGHPTQTEPFNITPVSEDRQTQY